MGKSYRTVGNDMSASTAIQKLFSQDFLEEALNEEAHRLLSLNYARKTLEALEAHPAGLSVRWIDVNVVGVDGSSRSADVIVKKLAAPGWLAQVPRVGKAPQLWVITPKGAEILRQDRQHDSSGKKGGSAA
jgi:hypothetical protein